MQGKCQTLGLADRGCLPIGGRYKDEEFLGCRIQGRKFWAMVYHPIEAWALGVHVVEELKNKKNGQHYYRPATSRHMFFIDGRVESFEECVEWGQFTDGYGIRLIDFDREIITYMKYFPLEYGPIGATPFANEQEALEYYAAWETKQQRLERNIAVKKYIKSLKGATA